MIICLKAKENDAQHLQCYIIQKQWGTKTETTSENDFATFSNRNNNNNTK